MDYKAEVHKAGRITIPIEIRKRFKIAEGDILTIRQENNGLCRKNKDRVAESVSLRIC